jgi:hypothetical protein
MRKDIRRSRLKAGRAAINAIDTFEKRERGQLSRSDLEVLNLLRKEEWTDCLGSAWLEIEPFFKNAVIIGPTEYPTAADQIIHAAIDAMRKAKTAATRRAEWPNRLKQFERFEMRSIY